MLDVGDSFIAKFQALQTIFLGWLPSQYALVLAGAFAILLILGIKRIFF